MIADLSVPAGAIFPSSVAPVSLDRFAAIADTIQRWDLSFLARALSVEEGWEAEQCAVALCAYKQFMAIAACHADIKLSVPAAVDRVWHLHILHTIEYFRFCDAIAGRYLHHTPLLPGQSDGYAIDVVPLLGFYFGPTASLETDRGDCSHDPCTSCNRAGTVPIVVKRMFEDWRSITH